MKMIDCHYSYFQLLRYEQAPSLHVIAMTFRSLTELDFVFLIQNYKIKDNLKI